jgi:pimeloyl-ACP methyl ester carboxylesterase
LQRRYFSNFTPIVNSKRPPPVREVAVNTARLVEFRRSDVPLLLIWGKNDPYLHSSVAEYMKSQARKSTLRLVEAGHWPQIDAAAEVARIMLQEL